MALVACPDCRRQVSDQAPACPHCGRPIAAAATLGSPDAGSAPSGVLRSNVDQVHELAAPRTRGPQVLVPILAAVLVVLGVAGAWLALSNRPSAPAVASTQMAAAARSAPTLAPGAAGPSRRSSAPAAPLPTINDISCDALESTLFHIHIHLAIFINGNEQLVPFGVGIGQPWQVEDSEEGPFVTDGACFYWIHTHTEDGVIHIESPIRRTFTLGDFFAVWQQPLSASQVGPIQGSVIAYVNGARDETNPPDIRLLPHQRIQLDVGSDVPPYAFDFPPGD